MTARISFVFLMLAGTVAAHPGHIIEAAGHDHWVAGVAIAIALGLGLRDVLKGKRKETESDDEIENEEELQEA